MLVPAGNTYLQFGEDLREESWLAVDSQHIGAQSVDDQKTPVPELVFAILHYERLQGVADLVAHVAVAQVQARQHRRLELPLGGLVSVDQLPHEHVNEHNVGRIDERDILREKFITIRIHPLLVTLAEDRFELESTQHPARHAPSIPNMYMKTSLPHMEKIPSRRNIKRQAPSVAENPHCI